MGEILAPYACDRCRGRKMSCSRTKPKCRRCIEEGDACIYSRSGIIRRKRKPKVPIEARALKGDQQQTSRVSSTDESKSSYNIPPSQLATDIEVTRDRLQARHDGHHDSLGALSGLSEAYTAFWHSGSEFEKNSGEFFLIQDRAESWADTFVDTLERGHPLFVHPPAEVVAHLRASQPQLVKHRAWLVTYYSIVLSMVSSTEPDDETLKQKLRANLWISLNDVRMLLEPSEENIQALTLLASHVEEFTTPSLSWMLMSNACRMLQAIGINHRRLDAQTRERRMMMFWHLNLVDKGLSLSLGRPPNLHRAMMTDIPLPTLEQLLPFRPHTKAPTNTPSLFGAHLLHQIFQSTRIQADIWYCLYEDSELSDSSIALVCQSLDAWYGQAKHILEAAAAVEKPFLDAKGAASLDLGVRTVTFSYLHYQIMLTKSSTQMRPQCIDFSREMLHLLDHMVSDSEEPFNGVIWLLVCRPFTPFLALFGELLGSETEDAQERSLSLAAMERLPVFLKKMAARNSLAAKLERVAVTFVQHARSLVRPTIPLDADVASSSLPEGLFSEDWPGVGSNLHWEAFFDQAFAQQDAGTADVMGDDDLEAWRANFFGDAVFDWIGFDNQV